MLLCSSSTSIAGSNLINYATRAFDALNRLYQSSTFGVNQSSGALGNAVINNYYYDPVGNLIKTIRAGQQAYTKTIYDGVRRAIASYLAYPESDGIYGNDNNVSGDIVIEQTLTNYDDAGNNVLTTSSQRFDDATGTGPLQGPSGSQPLARVTYSASWADPIGRNG